MMLLVGLALALPECRPLSGEHAASIALTARGHTVGGLGVVSFEPDAFAFVMLSPAGTELFTVQRTGEVTTVRAVDAAWEPWLRRFPFERDLGLLHTDAPASCKHADGRVNVDSGGRTWRGRRGPTSATWDGERWVLVDRCRRYTLTLKGAG